MFKSIYTFLVIVLLFSNASHAEPYAISADEFKRYYLLALQGSEQYEFLGHKNSNVFIRITDNANDLSPKEVIRYTKLTQFENEFIAVLMQNDKQADLTKDLSFTIPAWISSILDKIRSTL